MITEFHRRGAESAEDAENSAFSALSLRLCVKSSTRLNMTDWPEEGSQAPDFTLAADDGKQVSLGD
ncbi:MAG: hypothetical protein ACTHK7_24415, partial [Aureliella sp.]